MHTFISPMRPKAGLPCGQKAGRSPPPTVVVRPFLGHNALFYSSLTRSSDRGRRGSIRLDRDSGAQAGFEAEIMGSFSPGMLFRTIRSLLAATAMVLALSAGMAERVTAEDRANVGLTVIVLKTADQKSRLMRVVAPVGVLLPSGLGLKVDQVDVGRAGFVRCLPNGCVAEVVMDDNLIKQLRSGQTATFIIFQTPEEGIGFPMSLKGFGEGYDKLP